MKSDKLYKKIVSLFLCIIMMVTLFPRFVVFAEQRFASQKSGEKLEENYTELTFSDYGITDGTTAVGNQTYGTADGLASMDGVAFTGKVILQDSAGLFWWNAVRVGFGSGSNQGGIGVSRTGNRIILYNYCTGGAPEYLGEVGADQHGVADLDTTAVTVRFTFKYAENSTDVAMTISLNGTKYYEGTLTGGQELLGNQVLVWAYDVAIAVESVETEIYKELTFSDYGITNGTTAAGKQTYGKSSKITNMDGVAFTGNVILQDSAELPWWNAVRVGLGSGANQGGIGVSRTGNRIILYNYCTGGAPEYLGEVGASQHGVADLDTTAVTVRFAFKYIKDSTDVTVTFSLNGTEYYKGTLENGQNLLGSQMLVWAYNASITVESVGTVDVFKELTFSDYGITEGRKEAGLTNQIQGTSALTTNIDKVAFTGDIIFQDSTNLPYWNSVRVGCDSDLEHVPGGIGVFRSGTSIFLYTYKDEVGVHLAEVTKMQHGIADLDNTAVNIRFTFRYVESSTDVAVTFSLNGTEYYNGLLEDGQDWLGNRVFIWPRTAAITVKSVLAEETFREDIYHDLRMGEYPVIYEGIFSINGEYGQSKASLADTGIYNIKYRSEKATYKQDIIVYRLGQVHADGTKNDVRALVKAVKAKQNPQTDRYVTKAADFNNNNLVDDTDLDYFRKLLVTGNSGVWEGDVMPIAGYYGPIASYTNEKYNYTSENFLQEKYFQKIQDCGINLITRVDCDYETSPENLIKTLELCEKHQIRMFVTDSGLKPVMSEIEMEERMKAYSGYQSFAGIFVADEPEVDYYPKKSDGVSETLARPLAHFTKLSSIINRFNDLLGYVNLFPYYFSMEATIEDYQKYVDEYCKTCRPLKVISYDHYLFDFEDRDKACRTYFANMSIIREAAERQGIPYWAYVQCGGQFNRVNKPSISYYPLEGEFFWNVNTCLAMGAKGIQYFPLIQPHGFALTPDGIDPKRSGLIAADGTTTEWYDYAKKINRQISEMDEVLMNAEHKGIIAVGEAVNDTADVECLIEGNAFRELKDIQAKGAGALIGCFDYHGKTALYVVNYDMYSEQEILLVLDGKQKLIQISGESTDILSTDCFTFKPQKGEATLLVIEQKGE